MALSCDESSQTSVHQTFSAYMLPTTFNFREHHNQLANVKDLCGLDYSDHCLGFAAHHSNHAFLVFVS